MPKVTVINVPEDMLTAKQTPVYRETKRKLNFTIPAGFRKLFFAENLVLNLIAFLLGRVSVMGEMAPFGLGFFAAVAKTDRKKAPIVSLGALAGVLSAGRYNEAVLYLWSIAVYLYLDTKLGGSWRRYVPAPLLVFAAYIAGGFMLLLWQQATLYSFLLTAFEAAICAVSGAIFVYGVPYITGKPVKAPLSGDMLICAVLTVAAAAAGLGSFSVAGYSIRNIVLNSLIMCTATGGSGCGAAVGVAAGLAIGFADDNVTMAIAFYALAGTLAGSFRSLGRVAVALGFFLGAFIAVVGISISRDALTALAETAVAAGLFLVLPTAWLRNFKHRIEEPVQAVPTIKETLRPALIKLENISRIFSDLAESLVQIPAEGDERDTALNHLLSLVGNRVCGGCARRDGCWETEFYPTYQNLLAALNTAEAGKLNSATLPEDLKNKCIQQGELLNAIITAAEQNLSNAYWQKKITENRQMVIEQMKATASILTNTAVEIEKEPPKDKGIEKIIAEKIKILGCKAETVRAIGGKTISAIEIQKQPCPGTKECANTILPLVSNLIKQKLTLHAECACSETSEMCRLDMRVAGRFAVESGAASLAKREGAVNGDTCFVTELEQGKTLLMLSDGMGSGSKAAGESRMAVQFLTRFMLAGYDVNTAVKTVNSLLLLRMPEENFATVDMAVVDSFSGESEFLKICAAPSFIKRVREVTTVQAGSLPIGILNQVDIEPIKRLLVAGDTLVMVSDGVSEAGKQGGNKENWIANFLRCQPEYYGPQELADRLLKEALRLNGNTAFDDMTVLVSRIVEKQPV